MQHSTSKPPSRSKQLNRQTPARKQPNLRHRQCGAITFEYMMLSLFSVSVTVAGLAYVGQVLSSKMSEVSERAGLADSEEIGNLFNLFSSESEP